MSVVPDDAPDPVWNARLNQYFDSYLRGEALKAGVNSEVARDEFQKAVGRPGGSTWPRTEVLLNSAAGAFMGPVLGLASQVSDTALAQKHALEESQQKAVEVARRQGVSTLPYELAGGALGAAPYFALPGGALEKGISAADLPLAERMATSAMGGSALSGIYEAAKADPGQRGQAATQGMTSPWNLLFALGGLKGKIADAHPELAPQAGEIADAVEKAAGPTDLAAARAAQAIDPTLPVTVQGHAADLRRQATANGVPVAGPPEARTGEPLTADIILAGGQPFPVSVHPDADVAAFGEKVAPHLQTGGSVNNLSGDPKALNDFSRGVEKANSAAGVYDIPVEPEGTLPLDATAPVVKVRPALAEDYPLSDPETGLPLKEPIPSAAPSDLSDIANDPLRSDAERNAARTFQESLDRTLAKVREWTPPEEAAVANEVNLEDVLRASLRARGNKVDLSDVPILDRMEALPNGLTRDKVTGEVYDSLDKAISAAGGNLRYSLDEQGTLDGSKVRGSADMPLDKDGVANADSIAAKLAGKGFGSDPFDAVVSSESLRTQQLASRVTAKTGAMDLGTRGGLDSWAQGGLEGIPNEIAAPHIQRLFERPDTAPAGAGPFTTKVGESLNTASDRILGTVRALLRQAEDSGGRVLAVTHSKTVALVRGALERDGMTSGKVDYSAYHAMQENPGAISRIARDPLTGRLQMSEVNLDAKDPLQPGLYLIRHTQTAAVKGGAGLYTRSVEPNLGGVGVRGYTEGWQKGQRPVIHLAEKDPRTLRHELDHIYQGQLGITRDVSAVAANHQLTEKLADIFSPKVRAMYSRMGDLNEEILVRARTAFMTGNEEEIERLVAADKDRATVAQYVTDTTHATLELVNSADDSIYKRAAQRHMAKVLRRSGGLDDLSRGAAPFGVRAEMENGQYAVADASGATHYFEGREAAARFIDRNSESLAAPELVDGSALPRGVPRFALASDPFDPTRSPIETEPPDPDVLRGKQEADLDDITNWPPHQLGEKPPAGAPGRKPPAAPVLPPGFKTPREDLSLIGAWFRPFYNWMQDTFHKAGWDEGGKAFLAVKDANEKLKTALAPVNDIMEKAFRDIRGKKGKDIMSYLAAEAGYGPKTAAELGLTEKEIAAAHILRDQVIEPTRQMAVSAGLEGDFWQWVTGYRRVLREGFDEYAPSAEGTPQGKMAWWADRAADGSIDPRDTDAIRVVPAYVNQVYRKIHLEDTLNKAAETADTMRDGQYALGPARDQLKRFVEFQRGQPDKSMRVLRGVANVATDLFNKSVIQANRFLPADHTIPVATEPFNQEALGRFLMYQYMYSQGFRVGPAIRAAAQMFTTGLPLLGSKWLSRGLTETYSKGSKVFDEAMQAGATLKNTDFRMFAEGAEGGGMLAESAGYFKRALLTTMNWTRGSHNAVRAVTWAGFRAKVQDALLAYGGKGDWAGFAKAADIDFTGPIRSRMFLEEAQRLSSLTGDEARSFVGRVAKELVDQTQWDYSRGGAPGYTKYALGRVLGQYGIWPTSYVEYIRRLATSGDVGQRAARLSRLVAAHGAILAAGDLSGVDTSGWVFTNPMTFSGSPVYQSLNQLPKALDLNSQEGDNARRELFNPLWWVDVPGGLEADKMWHASMTGDDSEMLPAVLGLTPVKKGRGVHPFAPSR